MIIKNVKVYTEENTFKEGSIYIEGGKFVSPSAYLEGKAARKQNVEEEKVIDGEGCYAIPGLIDLHFHGCMGADFCDGTEEALKTIAEYEASVGVAAEYAEKQAADQKALDEGLRSRAREGKEISPIEKPSADLVGINMEGPFISPVKKGAQDAENIIPCDVSV